MIDLKQFCSDSADLRFNMEKPWSRGDFTYATNGHIIVRVPRLPDVPENANAPDAVQLMNKTAPAKGWMPVPAATMPPDIPCKWCDGTKRDPQDKRYKCDECNATGTERAWIVMDVGDGNFDQGYLSMIQGWEIAPNGPNAAWIRYGDALGLLMPRRA